MGECTKMSINAKNYRKAVIIVLAAITITLFAASILFIRSLSSNNRSVPGISTSISASALRKNIYNYLQNQKNRLTVYETASKLNNNSTQNACVYFLSEVLRKNDYSVPNSVCNTGQLISYLKARGWSKSTDYKALRPGDICFTTDEKGNKNGVPSHTYIFMGWVKQGSYDYAYVCDNQAKDYGGKIYHIRNIKIKGSANGYEKDAFSFFMEER